jgi:hypothetical protein
MNPHMLGEKDAAGRRHSLLGAERSAQVFHVNAAELSNIHSIADVRASLYTLNRVLEDLRAGRDSVS